jgi:hypothetical protein
LLDAYAYKFYLVGHMLHDLAGGLPPRNLSFDRPLSDEYKDIFITNLQHIADWCEETCLNSVARYARTCLETPRDKLTRKSVEKMLRGMRERLDENLNAASFKFVPPENAELYQTQHPFSQKVADNFPSANYDIEEAAKCYALERHTACVMHLMRVNEIGLRAFGTGLNVMTQIKQAQANWGTVLNIANIEIQRLNKSGDPTWTPEKRAFFEEAHAYLQAVKVAWRNRSMHADQQYDLPRAKRIYEAVRDWMHHMADHLDESGQFTP